MFNQRIENSQLTAYEQAKQIESSIIIDLSLYVTQYTNKSLDLCDSG